MHAWTLLALTALQLRPVDSYFAIRGMKVLTTERLDPIINPGTQSPHMHTVAGGNAFSKNYDYAASESSNCTTTGIRGDNSNYWAPTLYHINEKGEFKAGRPIIKVYYKFDDPTVQPFPQGLTMLAGDAYRTSFDPTEYRQLTVSYKCLVLGGSAGDSPTFPDRDCDEGVRAQISFPSCWDGKRTSSDDRSHVVYGSGAKPYTAGMDSTEAVDIDLVCPEGFIRIPRLFYEFIWYMPEGHSYIPGAQNWILSNGDTKGYSLHADFTMGWNSELLKSALETCGPNAPGSQCSAPGDNCGEIKGCPVLAAVMFTPASCPYTPTFPEANGVDADVAKIPSAAGASGFAAQSSITSSQMSTSLAATGVSSVQEKVVVGTSVTSSTLPASSPAITTSAQRSSSPSEVQSASSNTTPARCNPKSKCRRCQNQASS